MQRHEDVIEEIFACLVLAYGRPFRNRWLGLELRHVKADWLQRLRPHLDRAEVIAHALANLPERPPTAMAFADLCEAAPRRDPVPVLPAPLSPDELAPHRERCNAAKARMRAAKPAHTGDAESKKKGRGGG